MIGFALLLVQIPLAMWNIVGDRPWMLPINAGAALIGLAIMLQDAS